MRIAVLGLGRMGLPMAGRLVERYDVIGVDSDPARVALAQAHGIRASRAVDAAWPVEAAPADVLLTVLPGPAELRAALADLDLARATRLWIDATSCDPATGAQLHAAAADAGVASVAAPMQGGPEDARRGTLGFHLAGEAAAVAAALPVLDALGPSTSAHRVGTAPADAYLTKLLGNLLWFGQVVAVTEALLLAARSGLDPAVVRSTLAAGPGGSEFLRVHAEALLRGETMDQFGLHRVVEELHHLTALADESAVPFEVSAAVTRVHEAALAEFGARDGELLASTYLQRLAGLDLAPEPRPRRP